MTPQEKFVSFLQDHPGFYPIAKSDLYINLLSLLEREAADIISLEGKLPGTNFNDIELMLKSLLSLNLAGVLKTNNRTIYYVTESAKELLSLYRSTKSGFGTL